MAKSVAIFIGIILFNSSSLIFAAPIEQQTSKNTITKILGVPENERWSRSFISAKGNHVNCHTYIKPWQNIERQKAFHAFAIVG